MEGCHAQVSAIATLIYVSSSSSVTCDVTTALFGHIRSSYIIIRAPSHQIHNTYTQTCTHTRPPTWPALACKSPNTETPKFPWFQNTQGSLIFAKVEMSAFYDINTIIPSSKHAQACTHTPHGLPWPAKAPLPANLPLVKLEVNQSFLSV